MKRPLLTLFLVTLLSGCSAAIQYHPVVGYIDGQYTEDIGEEVALKRLIVKKVKEVSGSGVIRTSCSSGRGDSYFVGNVLITDTDIKDEYVVFRYQ